MVWLPSPIISKGEIMNSEKFQKSKDAIRAGWPSDRIISEEKNKIVLQCENGAFLIWRHMELPPELMDNPQTVAMFHNKVMLQFTEDLKKFPFNNVSKCIAGQEQPTGKVKEALEEFSKRVQIGAVFTP